MKITTLTSIIFTMVFAAGMVSASKTEKSSTVKSAEFAKEILNKMEGQEIVLPEIVVHSSNVQNEELTLHFVLPEVVIQASKDSAEKLTSRN